jgi:hypothetical protein
MVFLFCAARTRRVREEVIDPYGRWTESIPQARESRYDRAVHAALAHYF